MKHYETTIYRETVCMKWDLEAVTFGIRGHDGVIEWAEPHPKISWIDTSPASSMAGELRRIHSPDEWDFENGYADRGEFNEEIDDAVKRMEESDDN